MRDDASRNLAGRAVYPIGLGGARWSIADPFSDERIRQVIELALDDGVTYIDTAKAYTTADSPAHNESIIARVLRELGDTDRVLVGTKGGHYRAGSDWPIDASPAAIRRDCESSIAALGVDYLDLYYLHFPDPAVPYDESVGALAALRDSGLVRHVGLCNVTVEQLDLARGVTTIDAVQNRFSPYGGDRAVLDACAASGIPFVAYSPLGGSRRTVELHRLSSTANEIADATGEALETVLLAWLLALAPGVIALTGATRAWSLTTSTRAALVDLQADDIEKIGRECAMVAA